MIKVKAVKCKGCSDVIYSRAQHDFHSCNCGKTFIDGGFDYVRSGWKQDIGPPEHVEVEIDATKKQLYDDWNAGTDRYGHVSAQADQTP